MAVYTPGFKYKQHIKERPKMTCIIEEICTDGVVMIADMNTRYGNGNVSSSEKRLLSFCYGIVR